VTLPISGPLLENIQTLVPSEGKLEDLEVANSPEVDTETQSLTGGQCSSRILPGMWWILGPGREMPAHPATNEPQQVLRKQAVERPGDTKHEASSGVGLLGKSMIRGGACLESGTAGVLTRNTCCSRNTERPSARPTR
jgi:hypothetical protein